MILVLVKGITKEEVEKLKDLLRSEGHMVKEIGGVEERVLGIVGKMYRESAYYESLPGVERAVPISKPYKLVSRELHPAAFNHKSRRCRHRRGPPGSDRRSMRR